MLGTYKTYSAPYVAHGFKLPMVSSSSECCYSDPTNTDGPEVSSLYGECIFSSYTDADMDLTLEVQAAAEAAAYPDR